MEKTKTSKTEMSEEEVKKIIIEMAKKGMTAEKIGLSLRDEHGFQNKKTKVKISQVLREANLYVSPDIANLQKKSLILIDHIKKNKQDKKAKRDLVRIDANLKRQKAFSAK